jgi:hypothetical protein
MEKKCAKCGEVKDSSLFRVEKRNTSTGLTSYCRVCLGINQREYRRRNKDKIMAYYAENKVRLYKNRQKVRAGARGDELRAIAREKYRKNPRKSLDATKRWADSHKERRRETRRAHYLAHKSEATANVANRRARKKLQTPPDADMKKIRVFYAESARLTKETGVQYVVDHIIPIIEGGLHHQDNLQVITAAENRAKFVSVPKGHQYVIRLKFGKKEKKK